MSYSDLNPKHRTSNNTEMVDPWEYEGKTIESEKDLPNNGEGLWGFVYEIYNLDKDKVYYGQKKLWSVTNPEISESVYRKLKDAGEPVVKIKNKKLSKPGPGGTVWKYKRKNVTKLANFASYTGSNTSLNADIAAGDRVKRTIVSFLDKKADATFAELELIVKNDCLKVCNCYNDNLLGKFFSKAPCN